MVAKIKDDGKIVDEKIPTLLDAIDGPFDSKDGLPYPGARLTASRKKVASNRNHASVKNDTDSHNWSFKEKRRLFETGSVLASSTKTMPSLARNSERDGRHEGILAQACCMGVVKNNSNIKPFFCIGK